MKIFSLIEKYLEDRRIKNNTKIFEKFNVNKFHLDTPNARKLKEFKEALDYNLNLKHNLSKVLNHDLTCEAYRYSFDIIPKLIERLYWQPTHLIENLYLISTENFPKCLVKALPIHGTSKHKLFNDCITPEQFSMLMQKIEKEFCTTNKKYKVKLMLVVYFHSLDLFKVNGEGLSDYALRRALKNIARLSTFCLKSTFSTYTKLNIFKHCY